MSKFLVGCRGLDAPAWVESYFPEDLPDDWRLAYYSNEYAAVVLDWSLWQGCLDELQSQLEDVRDDFQLYFLLAGESLDVDALNAMPERFDGFFAGFINGSGTLSGDLPVTLQAHFIAPPAKSSTGVNRYLMDLGEGADAQVEVIRLAQWGNLRELRQQLEEMTPACKASVVLLWLDTPALSTEMMQQLKTLTEIMGIA